TSAFSFPRGAFDVILSHNLSLGASVGVFHGSTSLAASPGLGTGTDQTFTGVTAMPRIGYAARLSPTVSLWPRAGISFVYVSSDLSSGGREVDSATSHSVAATVEAPLVFSVASRAAFTIGPTLDISLTGGVTTKPPGGTGATGTTVDQKITEFGLQAGLLVVL